MRYYKATRPDGTDFSTGTVRYTVGEITRHPDSRWRRRNDPSTYLSVATIASDCTGMRWPCRLFAVEGIGKPMTADELPNKRCFLAVKVVEELDAHEALGPNGTEVAALIERARRLTVTEVRQLAAASNATWDATREATWEAAREAAREARWVATRDAAWEATWSAISAAAREATWEAAWDATREAAWALFVRDLISTDQFDILYGPWREVIGDPL